MAFSALSCSQNEQKKGTQDDFKWQVDQFDDIKILQYKVNGFDSLSLDQKKLVYYLSQAALAGRDILFDQNFKYNLPIRRTLEAIYTSYDGDKNSEDWKNFEKYTKKVWFANGIHHHYSNDKFTPDFSAEYFDTLVAASKMPEGVAIDTLKEVIFNPSLYAKKVNQDSGVDMVVESACNFYDGVTQQEVEAYYASIADPKDTQPLSYGLNTQVVKENGKVTERVWKSGGMYGKAIDQAIYWLEKAATVAENEQQRQTILTLVDFYKTGDLRTFDKYNVLWVKDTVSQVDFVNGFIENYGDPMGYKATWEAHVNFKDIEATKRTGVISDNAQWFEDNSPIEKRFKKPVVKGVSAKVITAAMLGGDCYPATPLGINLPNADWIRRDYGSKSVTITNISEAYDASSAGSGFAEEFIVDKEELDRREKYLPMAGNLHTDLHECLGHGSGQLAPGTKGDELKNYGSPLEEARADLFALYYMADPKMVELGIIPNLEVAKAEYYQAILNGMMTQLTRIQPCKTVEQAHMRCRKLIADWAYELGRDENVIQKNVVDGKTYIKINDYDKLRQIFGQMLAEIQRVKSEGDFAKGKELIETYAVRIDPVLHGEILERYASLGVAPYSGFVNPRYVPVYDENQQIKDIIVEYPANYVEQMLGYSMDYSFLPNKN